jgi:hypothetical protein
MFQYTVNDKDWKTVRAWRDTNWRAEKIMFFYIVQFVNMLNKGTLMFWSHFVLYLTIFMFHYTQNIANGQFNWFDSYYLFNYFTARSLIQTFHIHTSNYNTQFSTSLTFRWSTIPSVKASWQLSSVSCSKLYKELLTIVLTADHILLTLLRLALNRSVLNWTIDVTMYLAVSGWVIRWMLRWMFGWLNEWMEWWMDGGIGR